MPRRSGLPMPVACLASWRRQTLRVTGALQDAPARNAAGPSWHGLFGRDVPMITMLALRERPERLAGFMARIAALLCSDSTAPRRPEMVLPRVAVPLLMLWLAIAPRAAAEPGGFRRLGPGAVTVIPADKTTDDALQRADVVEITQGKADLAWTPKMAPANATFVERGRGREYPRDIWCLEFAFKPPRMLDVDVPAADLKMQRKQIWYLVYRVKNVGGRRLVTPPADGVAEKVVRQTEAFETPIRFLPHFVLESLEPVQDGEGLSSYRGYLDRLVPSAMDAIRKREDPNRRFLDSVEMSASDIQPGEERWGVAIWEDIDPRIDFFSIYVRGLTNAVRWRQRPGSVIKPNDPPGAHIEETLESLRLDFWRPGDDRPEGDTEMRIGFAGMFERMALGGRLLATVGWPRYAKSQPVAGLDALGVSWTDLLEPEGGGAASSLIPLEVLLKKAAAVDAARDPIAMLRLVFGDLGVASIEELVAAAAGPVDAAQQARRQAALAAIGLTPEGVAREPLASLAAIVRALESKPNLAAQRAAANDIFGAAGRRIPWLADAVAKARGLATLRALDADLTAIGGGDARAAFDVVRPAIQGIDEEERTRIRETFPADDARRARIEGPRDITDLALQGLFGPRGPDVFAAAVAKEEGVDYGWVFRYETDAAGL